jgi:GTP-binding nuclear protein Ran
VCLVPLFAHFLFFFLLPLFLFSDPNCKFVDTPALLPPELKMDASQIQEYEKELAKAESAPVPEGDDEDL